MKKFFLISVFIIFYSILSFGQANGKLQIHFIYVGQGNADVLILPNGKVVLFDDGVSKFCNMPVSYLEQIGITKIDYLIISHYHDDHIGCIHDVLSKFPLQKKAFNRGASYFSSFR